MGGRFEAPRGRPQRDSRVSRYSYPNFFQIERMSYGDLRGEVRGFVRAEGLQLARKRHGFHMWVHCCVASAGSLGGVLLLQYPYAGWVDKKCHLKVLLCLELRELELDLSNGAG